jgi:hypothetical protein
MMSAVLWDVTAGLAEVYHFVNMPPSLGQMSNLVVGMLSWSDMF